VEQPAGDSWGMDLYQKISDKLHEVGIYGIYGIRIWFWWILHDFTTQKSSLGDFIFIGTCRTKNTGGLGRSTVTIPVAQWHRLMSAENPKRDF
jgi:hypothetical protein